MGFIWASGRLDLYLFFFYGASSFLCWRTGSETLGLFITGISYRDFWGATTDIQGPSITITVSLITVLVSSLLHLVTILLAEAPS